MGPKRWHDALRTPQIGETKAGMKRASSPRILLLAGAALAAPVLALAGGIAVSQTQPLPAVEWDVRRLDTLDRNVRRLERALTQRNAVGQPVLVEPDPEVVTLMGQVATMQRRLGDVEATVQRLNGDLERVTIQAEDGAREGAALRTRLNTAETRLRGIEDAARAAQQQAAAEAEATRSPTGSAAGDLAAAQALVASDPAGAARAYDMVIGNWPDTTQAREAGWRLGDLRRSGNDMAGAVTAYAGALNGWPTAPWAGETTLKLARALVATDRSGQACGALGEFNTRYAATASSALKGIAGQIRTQANCR
jgi:TolA-binding protein